jgi:hypothetical protein
MKNDYSSNCIYCKSGELEQVYEDCDTDNTLSKVDINRMEMYYSYIDRLNKNKVFNFRVLVGYRVIYKCTLCKGIFVHLQIVRLIKISKRREKRIVLGRVFYITHSNGTAEIFLELKTINNLYIKTKLPENISIFIN